MEWTAKGKRLLRAWASSRRPRTSPQSSKVRRSPTSNRCLEPVTERAAPQKVTVGLVEVVKACRFISRNYREVGVTLKCLLAIRGRYNRGDNDPDKRLRAPNVGSAHRPKKMKRGTRLSKMIVTSSHSE